ncbi:hypothetical protein HJG45_06890 [Roseicella sp. DB1501]|nr:hypothetical protein [Roseicella sp. DB1501]
MNVFSLTNRHRRSGTTAQDARIAARFVFARPGWRVAERQDVLNDPYLEITVSRAPGRKVLTWNLARRDSDILVQFAEEARPVGPYPSVNEALLAVWEDAERRSSQLQARPCLLLFGLDETSAAEIQDLATITGFDTLLAPCADPEAVLVPGLDLAGVVIDLQMPQFGGDGRAVIKRIRQSWARVPVLAVTIHPHYAPEADLHGLGGPTQRERRPCNQDRVLQWLHGVFDAHGLGRPDGTTED